jgi:hypothetical protein
MSPNHKRKGHFALLSPNTKKARREVVHKLAVQVHELQLESLNAESPDVSSSGSKYGVIKAIINEAVRVYPWVDRTKVYNAVRVIKKTLARAKTVAASRVLQLHQQQNDAHASRKTGGRPKGTTGLAKLELNKKKRKARDLVATRYSQERKTKGGKVPLSSFQKICDEVMEELSIDDDTFKRKHQQQQSN